MLGFFPRKYGYGELISISTLNVRALLHTGIYNSFLSQLQSLAEGINFEKVMPATLLVSPNFCLPGGRGAYF